jgi:hypothetical protein
MYQAALGGYSLTSSGMSVLNDNPVYHEPGYDIMYPLELEIPECDTFYILLRKRSGTGSTYETLTTTNVASIVTDVSNGERLPASITATLANGNWDNDPNFTPLVLVVENNLSSGNVSARVLAIDVFVSDNTDNTFIKLRASVDNSGRFFYFLPFYTNDLSGRNKNSAVGIESYFSVDAEGDGYLLFSPNAYFSEVLPESDGISFSYPLGSIYYKRQKSYNDEDFEFNISSYSHSFVIDNVSLMNIPGYRKAAVLHIDTNMYRELAAIGANAYINIEAIGTLSGIIDTFKINLTR